MSAASVYSATSSPVRTLIVTGANDSHFANLRVLLGSWLTHMHNLPLAVCNYGMSPNQVAELRRLPSIEVLDNPDNPAEHPWLGKARTGRFLAATNTPWDLAMWIDADALFAHPLPPIPPLAADYDLLIDAHIQSVGEIVHDCNLEPLGLRRDDAYFSSGWWIVRRNCLLDSYERLASAVALKGNLWENDAFVAAIYAEKLKIRNVCGSVWHARGKTSLHTCEVRGLQPQHAGQPIYVLHANAGYHQRPDGRRVFDRPELAAIQDHYEAVYLRAVQN